MGEYIVYYREIVGGFMMIGFLVKPVKSAIAYMQQNMILYDGSKGNAIGR